jgi:hypothetical protein
MGIHLQFSLINENNPSDFQLIINQLCKYKYSEYYMFSKKMNFILAGNYFDKGNSYNSIFHSLFIRHKENY